MPANASILIAVLAGSLGSPAVPVPPGEGRDRSPFSPAGVVLQLGLFPEALCASDVSPETAGTILGALATESQGRALLEQLATASGESDDHGVARAAVIQQIGELREIAFAELTREQRARVRDVLAGLVEGLPVDLAAAVGGGPEARNVRRMLTAEARATRLQRELPQSTVRALAVVRAHVIAATARQRLASDRDEINGVLETFWSDHAPPPP